MSSAARRIAEIRAMTVLRVAPGQVLNKHLVGFPAGAVNIMRPSKWGNPFMLGRDGNRDEVLDRYTEWLKTQYSLLADLDEIAGKDVVCCCAPQRCHGDVLSVVAAMSMHQRAQWAAGKRIDHYDEFAEERIDRHDTIRRIVRNLVTNSLERGSLDEVDFEIAIDAIVQNSISGGAVG